MNNVKHKWSWGICASAVLMALSACSEAKPSSDTGNQSSPTASPATAAPGASTVNLDKKYEITMFQWGPQDIHKDDAIIQHINKTFNIDLKVQRILSKEYVANLELKIAANDMPDIFRYPLASAHIYQHLYEDDFLMNFEEYADKYKLEGLKAYMNREGTEEFREENGIFQLPSNRGKQASMLIVRQDWLDQLGLKHPQTWEEFRQMLRAFKDSNLGGKSTIPLTAAFGFEEINSNSASWTGMSDWGRVNGEWKYEAILPEYKEFIAYVGSLYQEGLIDKELFTANETQAKAKFVGGSSGLYMAGPNRFEAVEKDLLASNPNAKINVIIPKPSGPKGSYTHVSSEYVEPVVAVKKERDEDFLARVALLLDWMHSEEGIQILNYGIEGIHYTKDGGKMVKTEAYSRDILPSLGHLTAMTTDYSAAAGNVEGLLKSNFDYSREHGIAPPLTAISYGKAQELVPAIKQVYEKWMIQFITGAKDINTNWDQYVAEMNQAGVAKLIAAVEENTKKWAR